MTKHRSAATERERTIGRWTAIERAAWLAAIVAAVLGVIVGSIPVMILGGIAGIVGVIANDLVTTLESRPHHRIEDHR